MMSQTCTESEKMSDRYGSNEEFGVEEKQNVIHLFEEAIVTFLNSRNEKSAFASATLNVEYVIVSNRCRIA